MKALRHSARRKLWMTGFFGFMLLKSEAPKGHYLPSIPQRQVQAINMVFLPLVKNGVV